MSLRKIGSYVYIPNEKTCKENFSSWPSTRIFKITSTSRVWSGYSWVYYYFLDSKSKGVRVNELKTPSSDQLKEHFKLYGRNGILKNKKSKIRVPVEKPKADHIFESRMHPEFSNYIIWSDPLSNTWNAVHLSEISEIKNFFIEYEKLKRISIKSKDFHSLCSKLKTIYKCAE